VGRFLQSGIIIRKHQDSSQITTLISSFSLHSQDREGPFDRWFQKELLALDRLSLTGFCDAHQVYALFLMPSLLPKGFTQDSLKEALDENASQFLWKRMRRLWSFFGKLKKT